MPDNLPNISLPANEWVDLYAESGITVGQPLVVENVGVCDIYLAVQSTEPAKDHKSYNILKRDDDIRLTNNLGDAGAWAFCNAAKGFISVAERDGFQPMVNSALYDSNGNPLSSFYDIDTDRYLLDVHSSSVHNVPANDFAHRHTIGTTLNVAATLGDVQISVVDNTAFVVGTYVHLGPINDIKEPIHLQVTAQDGGGNLITLDRPLDYSYLNGEDVSVAIVNMVTGSAAATIDNPISYKYRPHADQVEHIERLLFSMVHSQAAADDRFGGGSALPNGVVLRAQVGGRIGTFTNWKTNANIKNDMFDVLYTDKAGGGDFGTNGRGSFNRIGVVIRLDPAQGDFIELLIQDPIPLVDYRVKFQGHLEVF